MAKAEDTLTPDDTIIKAVRELLDLDNKTAVTARYDVGHLIALNLKRDQLIAILKNTPATSVAGLRAKAVAIRQNSIRDIYAEAGGFGLASDIIRIFGSEV